LYERRNGHFVLQLTGHPDFGLPFGQDRLVPIMLATMAVQQKSQVVRFRSGAEMLDVFGLAKGGKEYRRLVAAFERIFGATIFFGTEALNSRARVVHRSRFNFFREAQIWYDREQREQLLSDEFQNVIVLSDEFYAEIVDHPIPTDLEAVKVLSTAPAVLDLFMWLVYRCFVAKGEERIPLFGNLGLAHQIGTVENSRKLGSSNRGYPATPPTSLRCCRACGIAIRYSDPFLGSPTKTPTVATFMSDPKESITLAWWTTLRPQQSRK
jgi:hypothetical protein